MDNTRPVFMKYNEFVMSDEKSPIDLLLVKGWERRHGPSRPVFMAHHEFMSEIRKAEERIGVAQRLLAARGGLTNRERKALDKEQRMLIRWLRDDTYGLLSRSFSQFDLKIAKFRSGERQSKARKKKLRWLARKHPSWVSEAS